MSMLNEAIYASTVFSPRNLKDARGQPYFVNYWDTYFDMYVLTTTANNPDLM